MPAYHVLYRESEGRINQLITNQTRNLPVPATPGWSVSDVVAHLCGSLHDIATGNIAEAGEEAWTAAQVLRYKGRSVADIQAEWHNRAATNARAFQDYGLVLVTDCVCHEFDIRGAVGDRSQRSLPVVRTAALFYLDALNYIFTAEHIPALEVITETRPLILGTGEPQGSVSLSWWEALRAISGRRSRDQVRNLPWSGDAETWLPHVFIMGPREIDLIE